MYKLFRLIVDISIIFVGFNFLRNEPSDFTIFAVMFIIAMWNYIDGRISALFSENI